MKDYYDNKSYEYKPPYEMTNFMKAKIWFLALMVLLVIAIDNISAAIFKAFKRLYERK